MRKRIDLKEGLNLLVMVVAGVFLWVAFSTADVECPDEITIQNKGWPQEKYGPVKFDHKKHGTEYKIACTECHHVYKDGKNVWKEGDKVQKCSECHNVYLLGKELSQATEEQKKLSLYKAYHDNCLGCHKEKNKGKEKEEAKAPTKCTACHAKKEAK